MTDAAAIHDRFRERGFIVDEAFATALQIMLALEKPLLIEGPAGVGKTESAKVLAEVLGTELIRLQCYEGLDAMAALYEWNYPRQMLHARLSETEGSSLEEREAYMFSERFLLKRPLLEAITRDRSPVLLIDEVDRADEAFEAFLLEVLAEWQVTIPELGTIRARHKPHVILTSNRTRELSDALRRRCLFLWLPYPSLDQEIEILHARVPGLSDRLAQQIARIMQVLRGAAAAEGARRGREPRLGAGADEPAPRAPRRATLEQTLGCVLKVHEDRGVMHAHHAALEPILGDAPADPRTRRVRPRYRLRVRLGLDAAPLMYPFASLPENLAAFCDALRREHGFRIGPGELHDAARALDVVDLANERAVRHALRPILAGTLDDVTVFDAAFTQFFFPGPAGVRQDQMPATRREPGTGADGSETDDRARGPSAPSDADADDAPGAWWRTARTARVGQRWARRGRGSSPGRATARSRPTRPTRSSCRASSARGAMPRDRSCAACTSACRAAGGRRPGTTLRPSTHAAGQPADRRRAAVAALAAPPAAGAANRAARRRQPLDERLRHGPRCRWPWPWRAPRGASRCSRSRRSSSA